MQFCEAEAEEEAEEEEDGTELELELLESAYAELFTRVDRDRNRAGATAATAVREVEVMKGCEVQLTEEYRICLMWHPPPTCPTCPTEEEVGEREAEACEGGGKAIVTDVPFSVTGIHSVQPTAYLQAVAEAWLEDPANYSESGMSFSLLQFIADTILDLQSNAAAVAAVQANAAAVRVGPSRQAAAPTHISRTLIYFHHIFSGHKKGELVANAADLCLGGCWKDGYPGIVVVEGCADAVQEYVRRIQRLHWKHMVVRGEILDSLSHTSHTASTVGPNTEATEASADPAADSVGSAVVVLDTARMFPLPVRFAKFPEMSHLAAHCRAAGLESLFLTSMKKYT